MKRESLCLSLIIIVFICHAAYLNVVAEDAYITLRYAQHLSQGHGLVWNIGEHPVEGYTNFSWVLLASAIMPLGLDVPLAMQIAGVLASATAIVFTYWYARRRLLCPGLFACVPAAFLAVSGPFAGWAGSGMETNLFTALLIASAYFYVGYRQSHAFNQLVLCCGTLLAATLTRPEGFLVFGLIVGLSVAYRPARPKRIYVELGIMAIVFLAPVVAYSLWRYAYFGYWLPNTFYAKTGGSFYQYQRGLMYTRRFALYFIAPLTLPLACLFFRYKARLRLNDIAILTCGVIVLFYTLYVVYVGGDYMAMFRFFVPILPFIYLPFGAGVYWLWGTSDSSDTTTSRRRVLRLAVLAAAAGTFAFSTPLELELYRRVPRLKSPVMLGCYVGILTERWHTARLRLIGEFFDRYKTGPEETLAVTGIGAISYFSHMPIYSITGIVDPYIAHQTSTHSGMALGLGFPGHEKEDFEYVVSKRPTYILYLSPERYLTATPQTIRLAGSFANDYQSRSVWLVDTVNKESGYLSFLELKNSRHGIERPPS
jgi:arabinofuranosyltransferase